MFGLHFKADLFWRWPAVNIPYWPHRIIVIGRGRLGRNGKFHNWQLCCYRMKLDYCCAKRMRAWEG